MSLTFGTYTTNALANVLPSNLVLPMESFWGLDSSSANVWPTWLLEYPRPILPSFSKLHQEIFYGILSDEEAHKAKVELDLFKKRFDDDLSRRNKILFRE